MKKAVFLITLFLTIGLTMSLSAYTLKRSVVGAGGFMIKDAEGKRILATGMIGQAMTGAYDTKLNGKDAKAYLGFFIRQAGTVGIEDAPISVHGISNYPNPVYEETNFQFTLNEPSFVTINVYNSIGSLVSQVVNNTMYSDGTHSINWNINKFASELNIVAGAYSYEMMAVPAFASSNSNVTHFRNMLMISK